MARISVTTHIEADRAHVWAAVTDWEGQARWMVDARSVTVLSPQREGIGVTLRCMTSPVRGIVLTDDMVVTEWDPHRTLAIRHLGPLVRGVGAFELEPTDDGTRFTWWEEIDPPLGAVGDAIASVAVVPLVTRLFRASLAALKRVCESSGVTH